MTETVGDFIWRRLQAWGVRRVFGCPGDGIGGLVGALARIIVMVGNNRDLAFVTWEERFQAGDPKWESSQSLPDVRYADFATAIGLAGLRIESPDQIAPAWDQALSSDRPMVLDFVTDPDVPPLPPHISLKQARNFMKAMLSGDPAAGSAIASTARELAILPGRRDA
jgi:pyruvate dehydrogenase (quinone)